MAQPETKHKKKYVQIILDPVNNTDLEMIKHLDSRYSHLKPAQAFKELMKRDMEAIK